MGVKICHLCRRQRQLKDSHVIPDAWFRRLLRNSGGQAVRIDTLHGSPIIRTQNSLKAPLLCQECEQKIGKLEKYGIETLRGEKLRKARFHDSGLTIQNFDYALFKLFCLSMLWRMTISSLPVFKAVSISPRSMELLRGYIQSGTVPGRAFFACSIALLFDPTSALKKGAIDDLIVSPSRQNFSESAIFSFVAGGYIFEFFVPQAPRKCHQVRGVLRPCQTFSIPRRSIFDVPQVVSVLHSGISKSVAGLDLT